MEFLRKLWDWLNGNKTVLGLFISWIVAKAWFVDLVGVPAAEILEYVGGLLAGVGVAHRLMKADTSPEPVK